MSDMTINQRMIKIKKMIESLINEGNLEEAEKSISEYEKVVNDDVDIYSMKAVIDIMRNKFAEALDILLEALEIESNNFDILYNLGYVNEILCNYNESIRYYAEALKNVDDDNLKQQITQIINNIRTQYKDNIKDRRKKLVFFVKRGMDSFLKDVIKGLLENYEIKKIIVNNYNQIDEGMYWADICWFEWCDELVGYGSKLSIARDKKIICRLHRYEAFTQYPADVNWTNVDKLIIVTNHIKKFLVAQTPNLEKKVDIVTINNGVNLDKYELKKRKKGFNIAYVGYIHQRKNPILLLQIINKLVKKDKRYKLYVAGQFQDTLIELYWNYQIEQMGLKNNVIFEGWQNNIGRWLEDKNYILSCSIHESFGYGIAEAMARGIKPIIHNFIFSKEIWDEKYLFNTIDEAVNMITSNEYNSQEYRKFIEDNYSLEKQMEKIKELLKSFNLCATNRKKESKEIITLDYINERFNEFIPYDDNDFNQYDFLSSKIYLGKREKVTVDSELIEFILSNKNNKKMIINNIWYNTKNNSIVLPQSIDKSKNKKYIIKFVKDILGYKNNFKNNIAGYVFDENVVDDIKKNSLAYNWERAIPASQFMPLRGYLLVVERYIFASKFINKNSKVLEAPCGFGYGAAYFSKFAKYVQTIDLAKDNIAFAKSAYYSKKNINWTIGDVTNLNYANDEFDIYVSFEVFEHLPLKLIEKYLKEAYRVIKKGGKFIISTPNREMRENINNPFHVKEYTFNEFNFLLKKYFDNIKYYSVTNFKVNEGMDCSAFNMIAVCEK